MAGSEDTGVSLKNRCWTEAVDPSYIDSGRASGCTPHPFRGQVEAGGVGCDHSCDQTRRYPSWEMPQAAEFQGFCEGAEPVTLSGARLSLS